jgi:hypothetical protein
MAIPNSKQAEARLSRPVSRGVAMGNIRGARNCWSGAVRPGRDFRGHRLVGHRCRYSRIAHSYISRSDDVVLIHRGPSGVNRRRSSEEYRPRFRAPDPPALHGRQDDPCSKIGDCPYLLSLERPRARGDAAEAIAAIASG